MLTPPVRIAVAPLLACLSGGLLLAPLAAMAQPDTEVTRMLFEPVPLAGGTPAIDHPLVSFSSAQADIPTPASEQPLFSSEERARMETDIDNYLAKIGNSEADEGPYADQLREDLFSTALLYQKLEDHENAIKLFQRTLNVSRINNGLESLDQVEVLEATAQSYLAIDNIKEADAMMNSAYHIQLLHYGENSAELVPAERKLGDWNTRAFMQRSSILVNIPRMNVQNFLVDPRNFINDAADPRDTPLWKLYEARTNYIHAIKTLVDAHNYTHPELMELERKLLTNFLLSMHRENILYEPDFYLTRKKTKTATRLNQNAIEMRASEDYVLGLESHKRRMAYLVKDENRTPSQLVTAMLEDADWDLLFEHKTEAEDKYNAAYKFFNENPQFEQGAHAEMYPAVPVVLPTYLPPPNSREKLGIAADAKINYFGYIDVSFSLTKFGKARRIKQTGKGGEITRNMEIRLNQYLRNVLFRPRYSGGELDTGEITLRYYVGL